MKQVLKALKRRRELLGALRGRGAKEVRLELGWWGGLEEALADFSPAKAKPLLPIALRQKAEGELAEALKGLRKRRGPGGKALLAVDLEEERARLSALGYPPGTDLRVWEFAFPVELDLGLPEELQVLTGSPEGEGELGPEGVFLEGEAAPGPLALALEKELRLLAREAWKGEDEALVFVAVLEAAFAFEVREGTVLSLDGRGLARAYYADEPAPRWRLEEAFTWG